LLDSNSVSAKMKNTKKHLKSAAGRRFKREILGD